MRDTSFKPERLRDYPAYKLFWLARVLSSTAFQINAVAVGWLIYARTGSAFELGLVGLAQFLPMVLLTLPAGHLADRYDRRRIARVCQWVEATVSALLVMATLGHLAGTGWIFAAVILLGAARAFESPALSALLPSLVPTSLFGQATALSASANQSATILGPALGGLVYALAPPAPYIMSAACFALAGAFAGMMQVQHAAPTRGTSHGASRERASWSSVFSGLTFIWHRPAILGCVSLDLFAVLLGGATALLPVFAGGILHTGPWGLGLLRSAPAVGALAMSMVLARVRIRSGAGVKMFAAVIIFGLATIMFALSTHIAVSLVALVAMGAADNVSVVVRSFLVQLGTPDDMRGRVSAVNFLFIGTSNQLGEFESGVTAALIGTVPAVVAGGVGTILVALIWMRLFPALRRVESLETVI
jgi:MFS family permease